MFEHWTDYAYPECSGTTKYELQDGSNKVMSILGSKDYKIADEIFELICIVRH
jgi:hypothetical protein